MAKRTTTPKAVTPEAPETGSQETAAEAKGGYTVLSRAGATVRTYTTEKHGKGAKALAETFAAKIDGTVEKA